MLEAVVTHWLVGLAMLVGGATGFCTVNRPYNDTYIPLQNCYVYYQFTLGVGTPPQYSTFLVDTGSRTVWVPSTYCACGSSYNESKSSTYFGGSRSGSVKYEDGTSVEGYYGTQTLTLNGTSINASQCPMLFATRQTSHGMSSNGIAGFGVSDVTFLDRAYQLKLIGSRNFILQLRHDNKQSGMYYNKLPSDILDRTKYIPLSNGGIWLIDCLGVRVNDKDYSSQAGSDMLVDSGTTLLILNQKLMDALMAESFSFCTYNSFINSWTCPQSFKLPIIHFLSRGLELEVHPDTYAVNSDGVNTLQITGGSRTILGIVFFKNYNITFDKQRKKVGFDGSFTELKRIGSDYFFWSVVATLALLGGCLLALFALRMVNNYKVKQR